MNSFVILSSRNSDGMIVSLCPCMFHSCIHSLSCCFGVHSVDNTLAWLLWNTSMQEDLSVVSGWCYHSMAAQGLCLWTKCVDVAAFLHFFYILLWSWTKTRFRWSYFYYYYVYSWTSWCYFLFIYIEAWLTRFEFGHRHSSYPVVEMSTQLLMLGKGKGPAWCHHVKENMSTKSLSVCRTW